MVIQTDPARQYAEICEGLATGEREQGDAVLASRFKVEPWSKQFWEIICYVVELGDQVVSLIGDLPLDSDYKDQAIGHIKQTQRAFSREGLVNPWQHATSGYLNKEQVAPIKMLSGMVRAISSFPKFDDEEIDQITGDVDQLLDWLSEHQLSDDDFIRQSLIAGLEKFRLKLVNFSILGWGCGIESLREVIAAYMLMERGFPEDRENAVARAIIQKTGALLKSVWDKAGIAKDAWEKGDWVLKITGAMHLVEKTTDGISGLIGS